MNVVGISHIVVSKRDSAEVEQTMPGVQRSGGDERIASGRDLGGCQREDVVEAESEKRQ